MHWRKDRLDRSLGRKIKYHNKLIFVNINQFVIYQPRLLIKR